MAEDIPVKKEEKEEIQEDTRAENMLTDIVNTIREKQEEFGKAFTDYTSTLGKPLADVMETEDAIIVVTDLPGVKKEDVEVNISEDSIDIIAKFEDEMEEEGTNYIKQERNYGETRRSLMLPTKIDVKKSKAKFKDSVLTVELPKIVEEKHKVNIS